MNRKAMKKIRLHFRRCQEIPGRFLSKEREKPGCRAGQPMRLPIYQANAADPFGNAGINHQMVVLLVYDRRGRGRAIKIEQKMKAVVLRRFGKPEELQVSDVNDPR